MFFEQMKAGKMDQSEKFNLVAALLADLKKSPAALEDFRVKEQLDYIICLWDDLEVDFNPVKWNFDYEEDNDF